MAVVVLLFLVAGWLPLDRWLGISGVGDGRVVAFLLAFVAVVSFVTTPVQSAVSRQIEARADVHALDLTEDPQTFAEMQRRLATASKSDVTPNRVLYLLVRHAPDGDCPAGGRSSLGPRRTRASRCLSLWSPTAAEEG